jgi:hypothetical protein
MTIYKIKTLTCGICGNRQRLKLDPETLDPSGIVCTTCDASQSWLNLPKLTETILIDEAPNMQDGYCWICGGNHDYPEDDE